MSDPCIICSNTTNNQPFTVNELQLGLGDAFTYQQCGACGTMQLLNPPVDFSRYYPNQDYYSFNQALDTSGKSSWLRKIKTEYLLFGQHPLLGRLLSIGYKMNEQYDWLKFTRAHYNDAILDVGTGNGALLAKFAQLGFKNLTGIDPFIDSDKTFGTVRVLKKDLFQMQERFDVIMLHHSLEHMPDPQAAMQQVFDLLKPGGRALIRVPIMGNYGWKTYGVFWCGLDAPRHLFIPSENGLKQLAARAGFVTDRFYYDSSDYVIWSSEQYKHGIPLHASNSRMITKKGSVFSEKEVDQFKAAIAAENRIGNGDTAALYLKKN